MNAKPPLSIFHNMARSGGTMVSKCLGSMAGIKLFSEIHPDANHVAYMNVTDQAHRWYGIATNKDVKRQDAFVEGVKNIYQAVESQNASMVLRDWASIDFIGKVLNPDPIYQFRLDAVLAPHFNLHTCALVRHPLDQWLSTRRLKIFADKLSVEEFFHGYRRYAEAIGDRFVQYEAFTRSPETQMQKICQMMQIPYDPEFVKRWHQNTCITGDNKKTSRGTSDAEAGQIRPLPRRQVETALADEIVSNVDYRKSIALLNY